MSVVVSFRIDRKLKEKMDKLKHINWSEVVRRAIYETIAREEAKLRKICFIFPNLILYILLHG
ncbi:hypothetical protein PABY_17510 [Pyrodictium abyssi]|uniref:Ribbon-helix-helix protein CopG domain-containing protein n=1 Tax=Pyrodictium abyssi TaxID=54256 RepID=A0ABN6ZS07_9CREN|nr:hypothetical protein PABY_17510 [Pyrodictium abyssi]